MRQHQFKLQLKIMVTEKARQLVSQKGSRYKLYSDLLKPTDEWKHRDFENLASMIQVSTSTLKRLYSKKGHECHTNFNTNSRFHFASFLHFNNWQELENEIQGMEALAN